MIEKHLQIKSEVVSTHDFGVQILFSLLLLQQVRIVIKLNPWPLELPSSAHSFCAPHVCQLKTYVKAVVWGGPAKWQIPVPKSMTAQQFQTKRITDS